MTITHVKENGRDIALVTGEGPVITDAQSAMDLAIRVKYETGAARIAIGKDLVSEDFFRLSTGAAGEILQKFINYRIKLAIYGDCSCYASKPLQDFIQESNRGRDFFFTETEEEALRRLAAAD